MRFSRLVSLAAVGPIAAVTFGVAPAAVAAESAGPQIVHATTHLSPRGHGQVEAQVPVGDRCRLSILRKGHREARSDAVTAATGLLEFKWHVPHRVRAGHRTARVGCGHGNRAAVTIRVHANTHRTGHPLARGIHALAVQSTEPPEAAGLGGASYPAYGSVMVPGSQWFGGRGVDVKSNGFSSNLNGYYQCVELVNRFLTSEHFGPAIYGNANQLYAYAPSSSYDHHPNASGYVPVPGDVIVLGGTKYGHVVVVDSVTSSSVYVVEQNASASGRNAVSLSGSRLGTEYGMSVIGILHAKANGAPPQTQPTPPPPTQPPPPASTTGKVLASPCLNFHNGVGGSAPQIGCIPQDAIIPIQCTAQGNAVTGPYGTESIWDRTSYGGQTGYVSDAWVYTGSNGAVAPACSSGSTSPPPPTTNPAPATGKVIASPCLNFHSGVGGSAPQTGCIPENTVIPIQCTAQGNAVSGPYGTSTIWDRTAWDGKTGYVSDAWVYTGTNAAVAPPC